jgi:DNA-binding response OmpR family regulator
MPPESTATVVVVNHDPTQRAWLADWLAKDGLEVESFASATAALDRMSRKPPPDLIVTGVYMPDLDGWRFCHLLRSPDYKAFNRIPILVVSSTFGGEEPAAIAADFGAIALQTLPADGRALVAKVRQLLHEDFPSQKPRILIVEDHADHADLLKEKFENHGYQVDVAPTGREAERLFKAGAYEVVAIDHHLPDMPGDQLLVVFQGLRPDVVYLAMTGDPRPELALEWMKKGAAAFASKPFMPDYLIEL